VYASTRLGRWFYEERGRKRHETDATIVLWHSFLCDGGMWDGQVDALAELGRVIVFDGPGHGKSEPPPPFSLDDNTRALVDALDEIAKGPVVMAGLSWGGMLSMRLSLLDPKRVRAQVLIDTNADPEETGRQLKYRAMLALYRRAGVPRWLVDKQVAPIMFGQKTVATRPDIVERFFLDVNGYSRPGVLNAAKAIFWREDVVGKLGRVTAPTLVLCGADDRATPVARSKTIARNIPNARLELIADAGHLSAVEQPEAVRNAMVPFIRDHLG
jgi:3-oxoadipate enol-lactonase